MGKILFGSTVELFIIPFLFIIIFHAVRMVRPAFAKAAAGRRAFTPELAEGSPRTYLYINSSNYAHRSFTKMGY
jgi:hypothetical protein